jgi:hypothetical protein
MLPIATLARSISASFSKDYPVEFDQSVCSGENYGVKYLFPG